MGTFGICILLLEKWNEHCVNPQTNTANLTLMVLRFLRGRSASANTNQGSPVRFIHTKIRVK